MKWILGARVEREGGFLAFSLAVCFRFSLPEIRVPRTGRAMYLHGTASERISGATCAERTVEEQGKGEFMFINFRSYPKTPGSNR